MFLSTPTKTSEGLAKDYNNIATLQTIPSDIELGDLIRSFSPSQSADEILPHIMGWIESKKPTRPNLQFPQVPRLIVPVVDGADD